MLKSQDCALQAICAHIFFCSEIIMTRSSCSCPSTYSRLWLGEKEKSVYREKRKESNWVCLWPKACFSRGWGPLLHALSLFPNCLYCQLYFYWPSVQSTLSLSWKRGRPRFLYFSCIMKGCGQWCEGMTDTLDPYTPSCWCCSPEMSAGEEKR